MCTVYAEFECRVKGWLDEEVASCAHDKVPRFSKKHAAKVKYDCSVDNNAEPVQWHLEYYHSLQDYYSLRLASCCLSFIDYSYKLYTLYRSQLQSQSEDAACFRHLLS